jgi:hypothetical protein
MIANAVPWPDGARYAVAMTWDMDADSAFNCSKHRRQSRRGAIVDPLIPRLADQFARLGRRLTFFVRANVGLKL